MTGAGLVATRGEGEEGCACAMMVSLGSLLQLGLDPQLLPHLWMLSELTRRFIVCMLVWGLLELSRGWPRMARWMVKLGLACFSLAERQGDPVLRVFDLLPVLVR